MDHCLVSLVDLVGLDGIMLSPLLFTVVMEALSRMMFAFNEIGILIILEKKRTMFAVVERALLSSYSMGSRNNDSLVVSFTVC